MAGLWGGVLDTVLRSCKDITFSNKTETPSCLPPHLPVSMTTRGLEDLDGGLGSCIPSDDLPFLEESPSGRRPDSKTRGTVNEENPAVQLWTPW